MSLKQIQALDTASEVKQEPVRIMGFDCVCGRRMEVSAEQGVVPAPQRTEQEPVAWLLTGKNINSLQVDSIQRLIDRLKHAHHTDIRVRINGHDEWFEADWLKHMVRVTPSQPEQNPMSDEILQAITDPENQPSQFGTVTLDYHFEKIKKWEDLFERMSNKVLQQPEQEPVAWRNAAIRVGEDLSSVGPDGYYDMTAEQWLDWALSVVTVHAPPQPKREPLTDEQIGVIWRDIDGSEGMLMRFARAIEAAHGIKGEA